MVRRFKGVYIQTGIERLPAKTIVKFITRLLQMFQGNNSVVVGNISRIL
ncbi:hypothetical protein EpCFBP13511_03610 [Erwinia persicina]|uniref:Uncharacterized protein n=1 Tax=Erwinia persicina TaxID=55211 RepID=A0A4U3FKL4_9GAMM|nr:hypothetical protein EpCFBP13511_03610 [Erwinia persicina]HBI05499.1 hypothetical protein [Erwinia persicina]